MLRPGGADARRAACSRRCTATRGSGCPTYMQLISAFAGGNAALRPYQTAAQGPLGAGHMIRLGAYFDPEGSSGLAASCPATRSRQLDPDARRRARRRWGSARDPPDAPHPDRRRPHASEFVNPRRKAGRIPLGRLAIVLQIVAALAFLGYTLTKKSIRLPGSSAPYVVEVEFTDAKGLDRVDEPGAAVAGACVGRVTGTRYEDGRAVATLTHGARGPRQDLRRRDRRAAPGERDPEPDRQHRPGHARARAAARRRADPGRADDRRSSRSTSSPASSTPTPRPTCRS